MQEAFLHFIWKYKYFNTAALQTVAGEDVIIHKTGLHNHNAGPDFLHAQVTIAGTRWAGHVEVHTQSSHWHLHKHSADEAYNNVILHVVYIDDQKNASLAPPVPVLELQKYIPAEAFDRYNHLLHSAEWVACAGAIAEVDAFKRNLWLERVLVERLEQKSNDIFELLKQSNNNWGQTAYAWLCKMFGFKTNATAFAELAARTPYLLLARHFNNLQQVEALLLGQAGFLAGNDFEEEYPLALQKEYNFLQKKYNLQPMYRHQWKFLRMHPPNFPTYRLAQLAALLVKVQQLLPELLKLEDLRQGRQFFAVAASAYWRNHFVPGRPAARNTEAVMGKDATDNLLINVLVPLQFAYGRFKDNVSLQARAQLLLEQLPAEQNQILRGWKMLGIPAENAAQSQALIQLKNNFCTHKKCLSCGIGTHILKKPHGAR